MLHVHTFMWYSWKERKKKEEERKTEKKKRRKEGSKIIESVLSRSPEIL